MVACFAMFICAKIVATWLSQSTTEAVNSKHFFLFFFYCFSLFIQSAILKKKTQKNFTFLLFFATESSMVTFPQET